MAVLVVACAEPNPSPTPEPAGPYWSDADALLQVMRHIEDGLPVVRIVQDLPSYFDECFDLFPDVEAAERCHNAAAARYRAEGESLVDREWSERERCPEWRAQLAEVPWRIRFYPDRTVAEVFGVEQDESELGEWSKASLPAHWEVTGYGDGCLWVLDEVRGITYVADLQG